MGRGRPSSASDDPYEDLLSRIATLEETVASLQQELQQRNAENLPDPPDLPVSSFDPGSLDIRLRNLSGRVDGIESQEDDLPAIIPEEIVPDDYVYVGKEAIAITGTPAPIIWINTTTNPPQAFYSSTWQTPFPDGYVLYDTRKRQIHIPRLG